MSERRAISLDPTRRATLLDAWGLPVEPLVGELVPAEGEETARLVGWWADDRPARPGEDEAGRDLRVWATAAPVQGTAAEREAAAWAWLGRLGEELDLRERRAPASQVWARSPKDVAARRGWVALVEGRDPIGAASAFAEAWRTPVRASFAGVAAVLRLPPGVVDDLAGRSLEQLDLAVADAWPDLLARLVETAGEPIAALSRALGPAAAERVAACVARRSAWGRVGAVVGPGDLSRGADAVVLARLADHLRAGRLPPSPRGLPGWSVVAANRARMRGRLRAAATLDPARLAEAALALDALAARTAATVARFAWDWAWREARAGFGFDLDRIRPPPCTVPAGVAPAALGPGHTGAVRAWLLLVAGRDAWADLLRWLDGDGRGLGRTFYRCLDAAPDALADPGAAPGAGLGRARAYERLRDHLADGGLDDHLPTVRAAAAAVAGLPDGRDLKARLHAALAPFWDPALPMPQHHLPGFRDALGARIGEE